MKLLCNEQKYESSFFFNFLVVGHQLWIGYEGIVLKFNFTFDKFGIKNRSCNGEIYSKNVK